MSPYFAVIFLIVPPVVAYLICSWIQAMVTPITFDTETTIVEFDPVHRDVRGPG